MNLYLKHALIDAGRPAYVLAMEAGINPTKLSKIIMGIACPSEVEKKRLAEVLQKTEEELFPNVGEATL